MTQRCVSFACRQFSFDFVFLLLHLSAAPLVCLQQLFFILPFVLLRVRKEVTAGGGEEAAALAIVEAGAQSARSPRVCSVSSGHSVRGCWRKGREAASEALMQLEWLGAQLWSARSRHLNQQCVRRGGRTLHKRESACVNIDLRALITLEREYERNLWHQIGTHVATFW